MALNIRGVLLKRGGQLVKRTYPDGTEGFHLVSVASAAEAEFCVCCIVEPECPPPICFVTYYPEAPYGGWNGYTSADLKAALSVLTFRCELVPGTFLWEGVAFPGGSVQPVTATVGFDFSSLGRGFVSIRGGNPSYPAPENRLGMRIPNAVITPPGNVPATISFLGIGGSDSEPLMTQTSICTGDAPAFKFFNNPDNNIGAVFDGRNVAATTDPPIFDGDMAYTEVKFTQRRSNPLP